MQPFYGLAPANPSVHMTTVPKLTRQERRKLRNLLAGEFGDNPRFATSRGATLVGTNRVGGSEVQAAVRMLS